MTRDSALLLERAKDGDREAMEAVLETVAPAIRRFALRMCKNDADAEDVVQDALLTIATRIATFEGRSAFTTWAFTLARSACARRRRGAKNRPTESDAGLETHATLSPGPEERASTKEMEGFVSRALQDLPDDYREVLLLRDGEGLTAPEAAAVLGTSVDAVKSRLHRARGALRDALAPMLDAGAPRASTDCPDVVSALSRKLEEDLDAQACAEMERHVASCPACARTCDVLKDALRACRTAPREVPEAVKTQVRKAVAAWMADRSAGKR